MNENETKWQKDDQYFLLYFKILPNEYFVTLEFDYTLDLQETKDKLCYCIGFGKDLTEGCFLQVSFKFDSLDFYHYKFYRNEKDGKHKGNRKEGTASFETFIEIYEKKYAYYYIYLYFISLNIDLL